MNLSKKEFGDAARAGIALQALLLKVRRWISPLSGIAIVNELDAAIENLDDSLLCLEEVASDLPNPELCIEACRRYVAELRKAQSACCPGMNACRAGELEDSVDSAEAVLDGLKALVDDYRSLCEDIADETL